MKKRSRTRNRRVSFLRINPNLRDSVSRLSSRGREVYDTLKERVFTREVTFILLVLFGGMIFFDAVGYDYTGMVVSNLGPEAITGAQAGIPDSAISNIGGTMSSIFKLIFDGFLGPALGIFGDNQAVATKLTLFVIVFVFILPVCKKIFKIEKGAKTVNSASIVAALISLLGIGLLPGEFVNRLSETVPIILVVGFLAGVLYGLFKWKTEEKIASFIKGLVSLSALMFLTYILGAFEGSNLDGNLSGAIWVVAGFGYLILAWLFLEGVFIKPFGGESKSASDVAGEYVERRRDIKEGRGVLARGKEERIDMDLKRKAPKIIRNAEKLVYTFLRSNVGTDIGNEKKTKAISAAVDEIIILLRNNPDPQITVQIDEMEARLTDFQAICSAVRVRPPVNAAQIGNVTRYLNAIRVNLNTLYTIIRT
ncbi:hypothetical protein J4413_00405 [Candidatus Woesearchaeota archaeon]|nr:hypothetical protein [Candidatus Woesearchaeota archaeon]